jgi:hypothetical protein
VKTIASRLGMSFVAGAAALAPIACGSDFDPASRVSDFRLLAVRADKPYAGPGERVELTTLSHEPFGRPVTWAWATCVKPDDTTASACLAKFAEDAKAAGAYPPITLGSGLSSFTATIPADVLDGVTARGATNVLVGVLTVACPGALSLRDLSSASPGALPFKCVEASTNEELTFDRFAVSVKRIYVKRNDRNQNPGVGAVTWDGTPWAEDDVKEVSPCKNDPAVAIDDCVGGERHVLAMNVPSDASEAGTSEAGDPFREDVVVQYYGTEGLFQFDARTALSPATAWVARAAAAGKEQALWFVVRDNRGGVGWTSRRVRVR